MSEPRQRKLTTMGIACLVASGRPEVLDRLKGEVFNMWLDVFGEMKESIAEFNGIQSRFVIITGILTTASFINLCVILELVHPLCPHLLHSGEILVMFSQTIS